MIPTITAAPLYLILLQGLRGCLPEELFAYDLGADAMVLGSEANLNAFSKVPCSSECGTVTGSRSKRIDSRAQMCCYNVLDHYVWQTPFPVLLITELGAGTDADVADSLLAS